MLTEEEVLNLVPTAVRLVARRFSGYVETADLIQEGYLWVLSRPARIAEIIDKADTEGVDPTERLEQQIARHCERYARKEKAQWTGYEPGDEYYYSDDKGGTAILADILQYVLAEEWPAQPPGLEERERVSGSRPADEGNNWAAMLCDVSAAYGRLRDGDRALLAERFRDGRSLADIGELHGLTEQRASERVHGALRRLLTELGGASPWR